jgi:hypothetical protein
MIVTNVTDAHGDRDEVTDADLGWFVYAVVDTASELPDGLTGVDDQPVQKVTHGRVAAVVSEFVVERPPGRAADLLAFHQVVDALAASLSAVVPVSFGSVVLDRESIVEDLLGPSEPWFSELVEAVRGRVQLIVQAHYDQDVVLREVVAAEPEIARLRELTRDLPEDAARADRVRLGELVAAAVEQRRAEDAASLLDDIVPLVEAHVLRPVSGLERVLDVALLVDDARRDELENRLEVLAEEVHDRVRLRLLGPTAAYDFVGDS